MAESINPATPGADGRTLQQIAVTVGMSAQRLQAIVRQQVLAPQRDGDRFAFSFGELAWLKAIAALSPAPSVAELSRAVGAWRLRVGPDASVSAVVWTMAGRRLVAQSGAEAWEPSTGQRQLPLQDEAPAASESGVLLAGPGFSRRDPPAAAAPPPSATHGAKTHGAAWTERDTDVDVNVDVNVDIDAWVSAAVALAEHDITAARRAWAEVLRRRPGHARACIELGRLFHAKGRLIAARGLYARAAQTQPDDPTPWFNLGVAHEDAEELERALHCYRQAIARGPEHADAHFNAARLCEAAGDQLGAIRHLTAYRRHRGRN